MVENYVKKPKKTKNDEKIGKEISIFQTVTHPSTDLARCCLTLGSLNDLHKFVKNWL